MMQAALPLGFSEAAYLRLCELLEPTDAAVACTSLGVDLARKDDRSRTVYAGVRGLFYDLIRERLEAQPEEVNRREALCAFTTFPAENEVFPLHTIQYIGSFPKPPPTRRHPDLPDAPYKGGKAARKMIRRNKRQGEKA